MGRMDSSRPVGAVVEHTNLAVCPSVAFGSASSPPTLLYRQRLGHGHWLWGAWVFFQVIAIRANEYHRPDRIRKPHSKDLKRWLPKKPRLPLTCLVRNAERHQSAVDRPKRLCQNRWQKTPLAQRLAQHCPAKPQQQSRPYKKICANDLQRLYSQQFVFSKFITKPGNASCLIPTLLLWTMAR